MIEKMEESNPLVRLMKKFQKETWQVIHMGPFMNALYLMLLKQPGKTLRLFEQLTTFINQLIDLYVRADADFMIVVEGGGASIAPKTFRKLLLPSLQDILKPKKMPQIAYFFGSSRDIKNRVHSTYLINSELWDIV